MEIIIKPMIALAKGERFQFNRAGTMDLWWICDGIEKDKRFPSERFPKDVWKISYHMDHPDIPFPSKKIFRALKTDTAKVKP